MISVSAWVIFVCRCKVNEIFTELLKGIACFHLKSQLQEEREREKEEERQREGETERGTDRVVVVIRVRVSSAKMSASERVSACCAISAPVDSVLIFLILGFIV